MKVSMDDIIQLAIDEELNAEELLCCMIDQGFIIWCVSSKDGSILSGETK
jgi:hypothetical protein